MFLRSRLIVWVLFVLVFGAACDTERAGGGAQSTDTSSDTASGTAADAGDDPIGGTDAVGSAGEFQPWSEELTDFPSLQDLKSGYDPSQWYTTFVEMLARRYPTGRHIVESLKNSEKEAKTWLDAMGGTNTFAKLVSGANTTVHEMNHGLGFQLSIAKGFDWYAYAITEDLELIVPQIPTFFRNEIIPYMQGPLSQGSNGYFFYLEGSIGAQDMFTLLDELNAYTHSSFTGYGLHDELSPGTKTSNRDGTLTFLLYTQYYLLHARENHPDVYKQIVGTPEVKELIGTLWKRALFILDVTKDISSQEINASPLEELMLSDELQQEIAPFL